MSASIIGPNCNVGPELLRENLIVCAGETAGDLVRACQPLGRPACPMHEYKCYRFWPYDGVTVVWTGIGTGCLEPLLWETLKRADVVRRIVLVGTAGRLRESVTPGAYAIDRALLGQTAISGLTNGSSFGPSAALLDMAGHLPRASIVSTDFFYGFPRPFDDWPDGQRFAADFAARALGADLIDMEVAQFYWLAPLFNPAVEYLAIKGPSNAIGAADEQVAKSPAVTEQCAAAAFKLLGLVG